MPFSTETEMHDTVLAHLPNYLGVSDTYAVTTEFQVGYRRVDLLFLPLIGDYERYDCSPLFRMSMSDIWSVSVLLSASQSTSIGEDPPISTYPYYFPVKHQLDALSSGLGQSIFEDFITSLHAIQETCIAAPIMIELKLRDWRNLISQTKFCRKNAGMVCAIMDLDYAFDIDYEPFSKEGIGFFLATNDSLDVRVHPNHEHQFSRSPEAYFNSLRALRSFLKPSNQRWQIIR